MFAITIKSKRDGKLYEITSPVRIPERTIVTNDKWEPFEVTETTVVLKEPFYNEKKIEEVIREMYNIVEIIEED